MVMPLDDTPEEKLPPVTLSVMQCVLNYIANDIEDFERRAVERYSWREKPLPEKLEEIRVLRKISDLIDRLKASPAALEAMGLRKTSSSPASGGGREHQSEREGA